MSFLNVFRKPEGFRQHQLITAYGFRGPGIQVHLARDLCLRISQKAAVKMSCGSSVISRLVGGKSACVLTRVAPSSQRSSIAVSKKYSFLATWASPSYSPQGAGGFPRNQWGGSESKPKRRAVSLSTSLRSDMLSLGPYSVLSK